MINVNERKFNKGINESFIDTQCIRLFTVYITKIYRILEEKNMNKKIKGLSMPICVLFVISALSSAMNARAYPLEGEVKKWK